MDLPPRDANIEQPRGGIREDEEVRREEEKEEEALEELRTSLEATMKLVQFARWRGAKDDLIGVGGKYVTEGGREEEKRMVEVRRKVEEEVTKIDSFLQRHTSLHYPALLSLHSLSDRHKRDLKKMAPAMDSMREKVRAGHSLLLAKQSSLLSSLLLRIALFARQSALSTAKEAFLLLQSIQDANQRSYGANESDASSLSSPAIDCPQELLLERLLNDFGEVPIDDEVLEGEDSAQGDENEESLKNISSDGKNISSEGKNISSSGKSNSQFNKDSPSSSLSPSSILSSPVSDSLDLLEPIVRALAQGSRSILQFVRTKQKANILLHLASLLEYGAIEDNSSSQTLNSSSEQPKMTHQKEQQAKSTRNASNLKDTSTKALSSRENTLVTQLKVKMAIFEEAEEEVRGRGMDLFFKSLHPTLALLLGILSRMEGKKRREEKEEKDEKDENRLKEMIGEMWRVYEEMGGQGDFFLISRSLIVEPALISPILYPTPTSSKTLSSLSKRRIGNNQQAAVELEVDSFPPSCPLLSPSSLLFSPSLLSQSSQESFHPIETSNNSDPSSDSPGSAQNAPSLSSSIFKPALSWFKTSFALQVLRQVMSESTVPLQVLCASPSLSSSALPHSSSLQQKHSDPVSSLFLDALAFSQLPTPSSSSSSGPSTSSSSGLSSSSTLSTSAEAKTKESSSHSSSPSLSPPLTTPLLDSSTSPPRIQFDRVLDGLKKEVGGGEGENEWKSLFDSLFSHRQALAEVRSWRKRHHPNEEEENMRGELEKKTEGTQAAAKEKDNLGSTSLSSSSISKTLLTISPQMASNMIHPETNAMEKKVKKAYREGVDSYLSKSPFAPTHLEGLNSNPSELGATGSTKTSAPVVWSAGTMVTSNAPISIYLKTIISTFRSVTETKQKKEEEEEEKKKEEEKEKERRRGRREGEKSGESFFRNLSDSEWARMMGLDNEAFLRFMQFVVENAGRRGVRVSRRVREIRVWSWFFRDAVFIPFFTSLTASYDSIPSPSLNTTSSTTTAALSSSTTAAAATTSLHKLLFSAALPHTALRANLIQYSSFLDELEQSIIDDASGVAAVRTTGAASPLSWHLPWNFAGFVSLFTKQIIESFETDIDREKRDILLFKGEREEKRNHKSSLLFSSFLLPSSSSNSSNYSNYSNYSNSSNSSNYSNSSNSSNSYSFPMSPSFSLSIMDTFYDNLEKIWARNTYISSLAHRFLKLALQLFIHFSNHLVGAPAADKQEEDAISRVLSEEEDEGEGEGGVLRGERRKNEGEEAGSTGKREKNEGEAGLSAKDAKGEGLSSKETKKNPSSFSSSSFCFHLAKAHSMKSKLEQGGNLQGTNEASTTSTKFSGPHVIILLLKDIDSLSLFFSSLLTSLNHHESSTTSSSSSSDGKSLGKMILGALSSASQILKERVSSRLALFLPLFISLSPPVRLFYLHSKEIGQKYRFATTKERNPERASPHLFSSFSSFLPLFLLSSPVPSHHPQSSLIVNFDWISAMRALEKTGEALSLISPSSPLSISLLTPIVASLAESFLTTAKSLLLSAQKTQAFLERKKKQGSGTSSSATSSHGTSSSFVPSSSSGAGATSAWAEPPEPSAPISPPSSLVSPPSAQPNRLPPPSALAALPFPSPPSSPLPDHAKILLQLQFDVLFFCKASLLLHLDLAALPALPSLWSLLFDLPPSHPTL